MSYPNVIFEGASDCQVNYCGDDPRKVLVEGNSYEVESVVQHNFSTAYKLRGLPGRFNSVCFDRQLDPLPSEPFTGDKRINN